MREKEEQLRCDTLKKHLSSKLKMELYGNDEKTITRLGMFFLKNGKK